MNTITRRIAGATTLLAAPLLIALGSAAGAQADTTSFIDDTPAVSAPAAPSSTVSRQTTAQPWQPRTDHGRHHHGQRRHYHHNIWVG